MMPKAHESMKMWDGTLYEVQYMGVRDTGAFIFRFRTSYEQRPGSYYVSSWVTATVANLNDMNSLTESIVRQAKRLEGLDG